MTSNGETTPADTEPTTRADLRADRKAAKARTKAMRPWYRKKRYLMPLGLVLLIFVIPALGGDGDQEPVETTAALEDESSNSGQADADSNDTTAAGDGDAVERAAIGDPAEDGQFRFTVEGVDCGGDEVGDEFLRERAQGQFCLLTLKVENVGDEPGLLFAEDQYLIDGQGAQHSASSDATYALDPDGDTFFEEINPGNSVTGEIVFDVPKSRRAVSAELHDSAFSGGVLVDLK